MKKERLIGLLVFIGILFLVLFVFYPNNDQDKNTLSQTEEQEWLMTFENKETDNEFKTFNESDFDFFVYRAHVLSSEPNAENLKNKINNGGYPSFVEPFGKKQDLFAVYVGPFHTEDDIVNNIDMIQTLSESNNGEILTWKH